MKTRSKVKKRIIAHFLTVIALCIPAAFLFYFCINANTPTLYETQTIISTEPRVYVTVYGNCYHDASCSYLSKSKIPMGEHQAINNGYYACSRCGGHSDGTVEVTYTKQVAVEEKSFV